LSGSRPPFPPVTLETAIRKVRIAEDSWNTCNPEKVSLGYAPDSRWRNRSEFAVGLAIVALLQRKWARELDYRLIKELWTFTGNLSRTELDTVYQLPRFNMPFELGVFIGATRLGTREQRRKVCLILDRERYRFQRFISDIAGQDIAAHQGEPDEAIRAIRTWLSALPRHGRLRHVGCGCAGAGSKH